MQHYRMDRPPKELRKLAGSRVPRWRLIALAATTIVGAAAITLGALSILQPSLRPPGGVPDWSAGAAACRENAKPAHIPNDWLEPGESRRDIRRRLDSLPLIGQERRGEGGLVVLGDGRFFRICFAREAGLGSLANALVTETRTPLADREFEYLWESTDGGGDQLGGEGPVVEAGMAGAEVARVEAVRADGTRVVAALADGIWVAWWTERVSGASVEAFDADGRLIAQIAAGVEVAPPSASAPPVDVVTELCLDEIESVPEPWRLPGEDFTSALERVRALPLVIAHEATGHYLFGDETFWVACTVVPHDDGPSTVSAASGPLEDLTEAIEFRAGVGSPDVFAPPGTFMLAGTATDDVARVEVVLEGGAAVEADLAGGYWMASWQENEAGVAVKAYDNAGNLILEKAVGP
jgi:hypothetical protein